MSSCTCVEICPKCGKETLNVDFDLNTEEVNSFCEFCGYAHYNNINRDDNFEPIYDVLKYTIDKVYIGTVSYLDGIAKPVTPISEIDELSTQKILDIFDKKNGKGFYGSTNLNNLIFVDGLNVDVLLSSNCHFEIKDDELVVYKMSFTEQIIDTFGHILACDGEQIYQERFESELSKEDAMAAVNQKLSVDNIEWVFASWYNRGTGKYEILFETEPGIIIQE